jgi:hypothetical protein
MSSVDLLEDKVKTLERELAMAQSRLHVAAERKQQREAEREAEEMAAQRNITCEEELRKIPQAAFVTVKLLHNILHSLRRDCSSFAKISTTTNIQNNHHPLP